MCFQLPSTRCRWQSSNSPLKSTPPSSSQPTTPTHKSHRLIEQHLFPRQRQAHSIKGLVLYHQEDLLVEPHNHSFTQSLFITPPSIQQRPHLTSNGNISNDPFSAESILDAGPLHVIFPNQLPSSSNSLVHKRKSISGPNGSAKW